MAAESIQLGWEASVPYKHEAIVTRVSGREECIHAYESQVPPARLRLCDIRYGKGRNEPRLSLLLRHGSSLIAMSLFGELLGYHVEPAAVT